MTPEKSPEEFWERFREESQKKNFDQRAFIKKVARGLMIEKKYEEYGIPVFSKQDINPNYRIADDKGELMYPCLIVLLNTKKFCIDSDLINEICDEDGKCERIVEGVRYYLEGDEIHFQYNRSKSKCIEKITFSRNSQIKY